MKKMVFTLLAVFAVSAMLSAEDVLIKEWPLTSAGEFWCWSPKTVKSTRTIADGSMVVSVSENNAVKENMGNVQVGNRYAGGFKANTKYKITYTIESNQDVKFSTAVQLNQKPWTTMGRTVVLLKAGEPKDVSFTFVPQTDVSENYRVPNFALGLAKSGAKFKITNIKFFEVK